MFVNIESKKISLFVECPDPGTAKLGILCRVPGPEHSAKIFFKKIFAECCPDRALGKEITKKIKKYLPSADLAGHSAKKLLKKYLPSASPAGHSAKKF